MRNGFAVLGQQACIQSVWRIVASLSHTRTTSSLARTTDTTTLRRVYATTAEARSTGCFTGANAINATPMMTSTADPISSPHAIRLRNVCMPLGRRGAKAHGLTQPPALVTLVPSHSQISDYTEPVRHYTIKMTLSVATFTCKRCEHSVTTSQFSSQNGSLRSQAAKAINEHATAVHRCAEPCPPDAQVWHTR